MRTYIVPAVRKRHPAGGEYLTADVEAGTSWVGQPIENATNYLIRTPHVIQRRPRRPEVGERRELDRTEMRDRARDSGLDPDMIELRWSVGGS